MLIIDVTDRLPIHGESIWVSLSEEKAHISITTDMSVRLDSPGKEMLCWLSSMNKTLQLENWTSIQLLKIVLIEMQSPEI